MVSRAATAGLVICDDWADGVTALRGAGAEAFIECERPPAAGRDGS